ncbi:TPA: hypothetical protein ACHJ26_005060 [Escherichia coli]|uniref:hypothetical protein n=1 Tax=Escherichia coli TaxID=562 RepID=UPI000A2D02D6|nr:hypothetical protein [Escherichia coli]EGM7793427.1 hypothetical protein [Escherichia coli]EHX1939153.1 hypothetical protein [Escherichia coli]EHX8708599.1 hypothetical protein [Escherichia coli]OTC10670.1 hypothetical protein AW074_23240 [Escherichia coli]TJP97193.1 hypothetical protein C9Z70_21215 [Escherichia coli]
MKINGKNASFTPEELARKYHEEATIDLKNNHVDKINEKYNNKHITYFPVDAILDGNKHLP